MIEVELICCWLRSEIDGRTSTPLNSHSVARIVGLGRHSYTTLFCSPRERMEGIVADSYALRVSITDAFRIRQMTETRRRLRSDYNDSALHGWDFFFVV